MARATQFAFFLTVSVGVCHHILENQIISHLFVSNIHQRSAPSPFFPPQYQPVLHPSSTLHLIWNYNNKTHYLSASYDLCLAYKHCRESQFVSTRLPSGILAWHLNASTMSLDAADVTCLTWFDKSKLLCFVLFFLTQETFHCIEILWSCPNLLFCGDKCYLFLTVLLIASFSCSVSAFLKKICLGLFFSFFCETLRSWRHHQVTVSDQSWGSGVPGGAAGRSPASHAASF